MVYGWLMGKDQDQESYDEQEAQERFDAALRAGLKTSPKPLSEKPKLRATSPRAPAKKSPRKP